MEKQGSRQSQSVSSGGGKKVELGGFPWTGARTPSPSQSRDRREMNNCKRKTRMGTDSTSPPLTIQKRPKPTGLLGPHGDRLLLSLQGTGKVGNAYNDGMEATEGIPID